MNAANGRADKKQKQGCGKALMDEIAHRPVQKVLAGIKNAICHQQRDPGHHCGKQEPCPRYQGNPVFGRHRFPARRHIAQNKDFPANQGRDHDKG